MGEMKASVTSWKKLNCLKPFNKQICWITDFNVGWGGGDRGKEYKNFVLFFVGNIDVQNCFVSIFF